MSVLHVTAQNFSLGAKASPIISWARYADQADRDTYQSKIKFGYAVGGLINFKMGKDSDYYFQTEFGFSQRGRKVSFDDIWTNSANYYFIEGGFLLRRAFKFELAPDVPADWFINIGPHINYWLGGNGKVSAGGSYDYQVVFEPMPEQPDEPDFNKMYMTDVNRFLFGLDFGIGFIAPINPQQKIITELRFTSGHTFFGTPSSATNRTLGFSDSMQWNEKVISIQVAYTFYYDIRERKMGRSNKDKTVHRKPIKKKKY